jgi:nucleoside-diphosphate-sugar epimerase
MPAVSAPALVLVTGASGFVGTAIIGVLREQGFNVRAVVRDDKKGNYIKDKYPGSEYVIVKDMNAVSGE